MTNLDNEIPKSIKSYKIEKLTYKLLGIDLYTATNTDINEKVLIHIFTKEEIKSKANEVTFMNNHVYLMKLLNHKNILKLYEIIETKKFAFLVFEYFEGVTLSDYISKKKKLTEDESLAIFKELLSALVYLHYMNVCNLNLNANNVIIDTKNNIKLCDFKHGHLYSKSEKSKSTLIGEYSSACPELISKKPYYPELADMWSLGVLLFQMVTGEMPFKSQNNLDLIRLIIKGNYTIPNSVSANMKEVIKGLIEVSEEKRFKIKDLLNQQLLKDKKITKDSFAHGLNILITKYPIDEAVLNICKNNLGMDANNLTKCLENNKFTPATSLFKQIVSKLSSKGIQSINDLYSAKFIAYINDTKNCLNDSVQINNIHNYLKKEEEIKKNSQDVAAILLNNQNEITKGLDDLKRQFERAKRGISPLQRIKSFGRKRRRTYQLDNKEIINILNYVPNVNDSPKQKDIRNMKVSKRNTMTLPDSNTFGKGKKEKEKKTSEKNQNKNNEQLPSRPGGRFDNINRNDDKPTKEVKEKVVEKVVEKEKKEEVKIIKQIVTRNIKLGVKPTAKPANDANKVSENNHPQDQKIIKKILVNDRPGNFKVIAKKSDNEKKVKINVQKEDTSRDDILKIRNQLKKGGGTYKSTTDVKNYSTIKKEPEKVSGFKSIKDMIEANIKKNQSTPYMKGVPRLNQNKK